MQNILNDWISKNSCENGYFTVVQYDDGPLLQLPQNTIVYGACSGTSPIPLIYEDNTNSLVSIRINNNLTFNNVTFSNTLGTAPQSGVDLEPDHPIDKLINIIFNNCNFFKVFNPFRFR